MNILVIGLGSMGKRRIRLIQEMYPNFGIYGVDSREDRRIEAGNLFRIECAVTMEEAAVKFNVDIAFVCTSPLSHAIIITECLNYKWNVFTELNLVADRYKENMLLANKNGCVLFLSSTFLYREEIKYIQRYIEPNKRWNYVYHVGQYLPDWHPWESYSDFFVKDKRTNGCRELMAIELPWLTKIFGNILSTNVISDKITNLGISYDDNYMIQLKHENGNKGTLIIDVVSPVAVRRLEAYSENRYIQWCGTPDSLLEYDANNNQLRKVVLNEKEEHATGYSAFVVENAYKNEIKEFMDVVEHRKEQIYGFEQDLIILDLIDSMEENL